MTKTEKIEFDKRIVMLAEMHDKKISEGLLNLYWEALKDLLFEDFNRVANVLARSSKFFPKPVEFRDQVLPDITAQASLAYGKVEKAFTQAGIYKTVVFDDPVIHAVVENLGGWVNYCNLPDEELKWYRKDFEHKYIHFASLIIQGKIFPSVKLAGLYERDTHASIEAKTPALIGDGTKILEWTKEVKALEDKNRAEKEGFKKLKADLPALSRLCDEHSDTRH
mgnify:CR=1 FL=1